MENKSLTIEDIQANYEHVFSLVGSQSYVNWENFTKTSTELNKQMEELSRGLAIYREIQQKRFLQAMKKLKGNDVPDLLKTVKAKKLPREALRAILGKFQLDSEGKIQLVASVQQLKADSLNNYLAYTTVNEQLTAKLKQATQAVANKIHESGLYQEPQPPRQLVSTFKSNFSNEILEQIKSEIKVQKIPGTDAITFQTYGQIIHNTFPLVKDDYKRLTIQSRQKQRKLMGDSKKYVEALLQYLTNTEALILEGQRAVVKAVGLQQKNVEESEILLMEKGLAQPVLLIQSGLRTSVKQSIGATNDVSFETTQKIIKQQVIYVKQRTKFFKQMLSPLQKSPENFQVIPLIIALALNDMIFEKYQLQEQDFMKSITDQTLMNNPQVSAIFKEMQSAIIILMRDCEIINEDMARVIQMQSQQIQDNLGNISQGMQAGLGGNFPGSNPMQLLTNQQKHQFDQMHKPKK